MEQKENIFLRVIKYITLLLSGAIFLYLALYCMTRTVTFQKLDLPFFIEKDNILLNIIFLASVIIGIMGVVSLIDRIKWLSHVKIVLLECIFLGSLCYLWCIFSKSNPAADQKLIIRLAKILIDSNQYDAEKTAELVRYIQMFPYQIGIVSCYQLIFKLFGLWYSTEEVQAFNVVCYMLSLFFMSQITWKIFNNKKVLLYQVVVTILFAPWFFMIPFCYGDMPSLMFSLGGFYFFILYQKSEKMLLLLSTMLFFIFSCVLKPNGIIFVAAVCCILVMKAISTKKIKWVILAAVLFAICNMTLPTLKQIYNAKYDLHMQEGSPVYGNMLMGLSESFNAGRYTGYVVKVYDRFEPDADAMKRDAIIQIKQRINDFSTDIPYAINFFKEKIATEYCEPTYEALLNNKYYSGEAAFVTDIYYGKMGETLTSFLNYFQLCIYVLSFLYIVWLMREKTNPDCFLFIIYFLGIFLFQLVWEAQGRYVLPSIIALLPGVAYGCKIVEDILMKLKGKMKK